MEAIRVPVKLEVLYESIEAIRKTLSNIQPGTAKWKELNTLLKDMEKTAKNLEVAVSKPFSSQSDFTSAQKNISKIDDALAKMRVTMNSIKFSDIKLNVDQTDELKKIQDEFKAIEGEVDRFKASLKSTLQMKDIWKDIENVDPNAVTHSFDEIVRVVQQKVSKLDEANKKAQQSFENVQEQTRRADNTKKFFANGAKNALSAKSLGSDVFEQFFTNGTGGLQFKKGQRTPFYDWVKANLSLSDAEFASIKDSSITSLKKKLGELDLDSILKRSEKDSKTGADAKNNANFAKQNYDQAYAVLMELATALDLVADKEESLGGRTEAAQAALAKFMQRVTETARESKSFESAASQMQSQISQLRTSVSQADAQFLKLQRTTQQFNSIKMAIVNFMGFHQVLNLVKSAATAAFKHIKELDTVMNNISIVTNMSTGDLWSQIDAYSKMAQTYGTSIKGAYEVSQIYYQQGLQTNDVLTLTNETLKLSKISGLDYATTTDYMTTALRGFKMEMSDASIVVDVYSNLAAHTAASSEEIAIAMSKTASSMESVGASFQEASAMIATTVAVTRESATNIGSALKSIAARYGEMKKDPSALIDADGQALSYNKVDDALQSVGISLKDTNGQFRNITDVILELSDVWDQLDSTQQRYIATQFAGNRQQSRFLALVSNGELLRKNLSYAENSEDTGSLQAIKALDSIDTKLEQVKVAYQEMYTSVGLEDIFKGALDGVKNYINYLNSIPKIFGKFPIAAVSAFMNITNILRTVGVQAVSSIAEIFKQKLLSGNAIPDYETFMIEKFFNKRKAKQAAKEMDEGMSEAAAKGSATKAKLQADAQKATEVGTETGAAKGQMAKAATDARKDAYRTMLKDSGVPLDSISAQKMLNNINQNTNGVQNEEFLNKLRSQWEINEQGRITGKTAMPDLNKELPRWQEGFDTSAYLKFFDTMNKLGGKEADLQGKALANFAENVPKGEQFNLANLQALQKKQDNGLSNEGQAALVATTSLADNINKIDSNALSNLKEQLSGIDFNSEDATAQVQTAINKVIEQAGDVGPQLREAFVNGGEMGIAGLVIGLSDTSPATSAASAAGTAVIASLKSAMGVASPSVLAKIAGENVIEGLVQGLKGKMGEAIKTAAENGTSIIDAIMENTEMDESTFDQLKEQLIKQVSSLSDEVASAAEKQEGIDFLSNLTLADVKSGKAGPEMAKWLGMFSEGQIKSGKTVLSEQMGPNTKQSYRGFRDTIPGMTPKQGYEYEREEQRYKNKYESIAKKHGFATTKEKEKEMQNLFYDTQNNLTKIEEDKQKLIDEKLSPMKQQHKQEQDNLADSIAEQHQPEIDDIDKKIAEAEKIEAQFKQDTLKYYKDDGKTLKGRNSGKNLDALRAKLNQDLAVVGGSSEELKKQKSALEKKIQAEQQEAVSKLQKSQEQELAVKRAEVEKEVNEDEELEARRKRNLEWQKKAKTALTPQEEWEAAFTDEERETLAQMRKELDERRQKAQESYDNTQATLDTKLGEAQAATTKSVTTATEVDAAEASKKAEEEARKKAEEEEEARKKAEEEEARKKAEEEEARKKAEEEERDREIAEKPQAAEQERSVEKAQAAEQEESARVQKENEARRKELEARRAEEQARREAEQRIIEQNRAKEQEEREAHQKEVQENTERITPQVKKKAYAEAIMASYNQKLQSQLTEHDRLTQLHNLRVQDIEDKYSGVKGFFGRIVHPGQKQRELDAERERYEYDIKPFEEKISTLRTKIDQGRQLSLGAHRELTSMDAYYNIPYDEREKVVQDLSTNYMEQAQALPSSVLDKLDLSNPDALVETIDSALQAAQEKVEAQAEKTAQETPVTEETPEVTETTEENTKTSEAIEGAAEIIDESKEESTTPKEPSKESSEEPLVEEPSKEPSKEPSEQPPEKPPVKMPSPENLLTVPVEPVKPEEVKKEEPISVSDGQATIDNVEEISKMEQQLDALNNLRAAREKFSSLKKGEEGYEDAKAERAAAGAAAKEVIGDEAKIRTDYATEGENQLYNELVAKLNIDTTDAQAKMDEFREENSEIPTTVTSEDDSEEDGNKDSGGEGGESKGPKDVVENLKELGDNIEVPEEEDGKEDLSETKENIESVKEAAEGAGDAGEQAGNAAAAGMAKASQGADKAGQSATKLGSKFRQCGSAIGSVVSFITGFFDQTTEGGARAAGAITALGGAITVALSTGPQAVITGIITAITGIMAVIKSFSLDSKIERASKKAEELSKKAKTAKAEAKDLEEGISKYKELKEKRYESADAAEAYQEQVNELAEKFPSLIVGFDEAGNAIIDISQQEQALTDARQAAAKATREAAEAEIETLKLENEKKANTIKSNANKTSFLYMDNMTANDIISDEKYGLGNMFSVGMDEVSAFQSGYAQVYDMATGNQDAAYEYFHDLAERLEDPDTQSNLTKENREWYTYLKSINFEKFKEEGTYNLEGLYQSLESRRQSGAIMSEKDAKLYWYLAEKLGHGTVADVSFAKTGAKDFSKLTSYEGVDLNDFQNYYDTKFGLDNEDVSDAEIAATLLEDMNAAVNADKLDEAAKYYGYLQTFWGNLDPLNYFKITNADQMKSIRTDSGTALKEWLANVKLINSNEGIITSSVLQENGWLSTDVLKHNDLVGLITKGLDWQYETYGNNMDHTQFMQENGEKAANAINLWWAELGTRFNEDNTSFQDSLLSMLNDTKHYSADDIIREIGLDKSDETDQVIIDFIKARYGTLSEDVEKSLDKNLDKQVNDSTVENTKLKKIQSHARTSADKRELTSIDASYYNMLATNVDKLENRGYTGKADILTTQGLELYDALNADEVQEKARNAILDVVLAEGMASEEAIDKAIKEAKAQGFGDNSEVVQTLQRMKESLVTNIKLSLDTMTDELTSNWSDSSKSLKKLTSGMAFTDMQGMLDEAESFGEVTLASGEVFSLTAEDFKQDNGKLVLTAEKAAQYWEAWSIKQREKTAKISKLLEDENDGAKAILKITEDSEGNYQFAEEMNKDKFKELAEKSDIQFYDALHTVLGDQLDNYLERKDGKIVRDKDGRGKIDVKKIGELRDDVLSAYKDDKEALDLYLKYLDAAEAEINRQNAWKKGDYSSIGAIYKSAKDKGLTQFSDADYQKRMEELASGAKYEDWELDEPDIKNAVEKMSSGYNKLLTDILKKGINNINLKSYEGIVTSNIDLSGSLTDIAIRYARIATGTLSDANDLILQAYDKENNITKFSNSQISGLQFLDETRFSATASELKEFVNNFQLDLGALIQKGIAYYDSALGEYVVEFGRIAEEVDSTFDLSQVEGYAEAMRDSIASFFKTIREYLQNGIKGTLTNQNAKQLQDWATSHNLGQLSFNETAEGLKLSEESAIQLYTTLKQIKPLEASLVFDDLRDSLEKTHEEFESVTGLLGYIADTSAKISNADSKVSDNRLKQYQAELSVAQEILAVRATQEDSSFSFMSNKIPGAQNNPINYYENWASAFGKIRTALQTKASVTNRKTGKKELRQGLIDYEDWYNIVTEMGHIAEMVGGDGIKFGNKTLKSAEDAAALIEEGAKALTVDKSGNVKVALGSIAGLGIDMKTGAETMADNVDEGIRSVAKSQVKMLDGLIAMLEIIVAMEQLGDITGEDTTIDLGDIFAVGGQAVADDNLELVDGYTDKFNNAQAKLKDYLEKHADAKKLFENTKMRLGGQSTTMYDMLVKDYKETWGKMELQGENKKKAMTAFQGMLNSFYQAAISGNFDTTDIAASVQKVMNETGLKLSDFVFNFTDDAGNITRTLTYVGNTLVNIDWQDDKTRKQFDKLFGNGRTVQEYYDYIQSLIEEYWKNMEGGEEVTLDRQIEIRTRLGVASNEFVISKGKDSQGHTQYTGYYDGQKFTGNDQNKILEQMAKAAMYKDQGFDFTLEKDSGTDNVTAVKGKTTVSGVEVEVNFNNQGQVRYSYNGEDDLTEEQLAAQLASEGRQEKGGTYHYTDTQGEHTVTVQYDATMGISYSYDVITGQENGVYKYNGHEFTSYDALYKFNEFRKAIDPNNAGHWTDNNQYVFTVTSKNGIKINSQYDATTGEISVKIGDRTITGIDSKTLAEYMKVAQMAEFEESTSEQAGTTEGATIREFKFNVGNAVINGTIDLKEGTTTYTYTSTDGNTIGTANSLEALQAILKMANLGDLENKTLEGQEVTWTVEGISVKLKFNKEGKVEFVETTDGRTLTDEEQKIVEDAIAEMNKNAETLENDAEVQASKVIVKTAGAEVTMDPETLKIAEATGEITHLKATAKEVDADGNIKGVQVTGVADGEVHFKVGEVDKPTDDQLKADGIVNWTNNYTAPVIDDLHRNVFWHHKGSATGNLFMDQATGNIGLAKAAGTLMGELGPELVVSNGRYFVAGQNGPEMVNLADDAIVFNHLQTKSLLEKGMSSGRGKAITNERNAVAFAKGNIHGGPAKASAASALAALKQLRAQWQALAELSAKDLAQKGGGGGGGGGDPKAFLKQLEKWYNWLQQIAKLEKDISLEEARRSKIQSDMYAHGQDYYKSQMESLDAIKKTLVVQDSLAKSQEEYFNQRRNELNNESAFNALYKFSESGQLYYQPGALEWLSDLSGRNATTGEANYTAKEQYEKIVAAGYGFAMEYDSSGNKIKQEGEDWYSTALQAFWDKIDADKEEMQSLHDSVEDAKNNVLKNQESMNQILRDIEDNQIAVEQKVLKAVEESRQRAIDDAQEQRDALEEASNNVINGLSEQLQKEQDMYSQQQETDELSKLQRQLAILQRSGGSASQIADLQQQIAEKQQDMYFDMQQKQIDALQEASDNELERLDHQIDIMTETLEYEKENGLLWNKVNEILQGSPQEIARYIQDNTEEYWGKSTTDLAKTIREDLFDIQRFKEFQEDTSDIKDLLHQAFGIEDAKEEQQAKQTDFIKGLYQELLGREADEGGLNYWLEQMAAGMSEEDIRAGFMNSAEYKKLHGITDTSATNTATTSTNTQSNSKNKNNSQPVYGYYETNDKGVRQFTVVKSSKVEAVKDDKGKIIGYQEKESKRELIKHAKGGYNYETGLAWLDGTKDNPEAVLNPEQTRILRENILSSRPDSLVSLLKSYNEAYHGLSASTYDSISNNTNNATIIERAEVNLQVAQLANDYDSKRAANTIMDEMLRIASKTSANNSVRR